MLLSNRSFSLASLLQLHAKLLKRNPAPDANGCKYDIVKLWARHDPVCMTAAASCTLQLWCRVYNVVSLVWLTAETG